MGKNIFESIGYSFSYDFVNDIAKGYGSIITRIRGIFLLRNKANMGFIKLTRVTFIVKDLKYCTGDLSAFDIPIVVVEDSWEAIRARSSKTFHSFDGCSNFFSSELTV
jgi:hypothetical protein